MAPDRAMALIAACTMMCSVTRAQLRELAEFAAEGGEQYDYFGQSLAASGTRVVVGAWGDDDAGPQAGAAYVFDLSDARHPLQVNKLVPADGGDWTEFGAAVAIDGDLIAVGMSRDDSVPGGSVRLFEAAGGLEFARLVPADGQPGVGFGAAVAIDGSRAIVGAPAKRDHGAASGAAYLFDVSDPSAPAQIAKLLPDEIEAYDRFGYSVAISGELAVVSAPYDDDVGGDAGAVYLFHASTGAQLAKITVSEGSPLDYFGCSFAIDADLLLVGAEGHPDGHSTNGAAYTIDISDPSAPAVLSRLGATDGEQYDRFGFSVALCEATAVIGAPAGHRAGAVTGAAYLFDLSAPDQPVQVAKLLASDAAAGDRFGTAVAATSSVLLVGNPAADDQGEATGSSYIFDPSTCLPDLNRDGWIDTRDLIEFLSAWASAGAIADWNVDGEINTVDVIAFLNSWNGGCP